MTTTTSASVLPDDRPAPALERPLLFAGVLVGLLHLAMLVFMVLFLSTSHPPVDVSAADAARDFHEVGGLVSLGTWLLLLVVPLGLVFVGALTGVLRRVAGEAVAATAHLTGGATFLLVGVGALLSSVTASIGGDDTSPAAGAVVKAFDAFTPLAFATSAFPRAVLIVLVATALARAGLAGRGLVGFSWVLAVVGLVGTGTVFTAALFPLAVLPALLFAAWCASVAVILRRRLG